MAADPISVLAVDWGASSIRVGRVTMSADGVDVDVVHRFAHRPVVDAAGAMRWDWDRLVAETEHGLAVGLARGPAASIGVDTWAVDYGLLDGHGQLLSPPFCYRDPRTARYRAVVERIGVERFYGVTGLQLLPFNTVFQLAAHDPRELRAAERLALLPDLLVGHLTGFAGTERTVASTTGLLDVRHGTWSALLCEELGLPDRLLSPVHRAGEHIGGWRGVPVHLVGAHDTASAVVAGARDGEHFVATGTWLLVGDERDEPDTSEASRAAGFTNELGALGGVRYLRNVAGWWLIDECARTWGTPVQQLLAEAADATRDVPVFDATDERFLTPASMPAEIAAAAGVDAAADRALLIRIAIESMADAVAVVARRLEGGGPARPIRVFGGGSRSELFVDALARRLDAPVRRGPVEATIIGNALAQGVALGVFGSLTEARAAVAIRCTTR